MKRSIYREQDYAFGQTMLTLRSAIGLTQGGLAEVLGVSRRSVADWEAGGKYPTAEHLKHLIAFAITHKGFHAGHELEEIRSLWKAAHQKTLLDELWLADLLPQGQTRPAQAPTEIAHNQEMSPAEDVPLVDWEYAPDIPNFYGREQELALLTQWVVEERCRVVGVLGLGGIGKSALSIRFMRQIAEHFDVVIWRSLRDAPACELLLDDCLQILAPTFATEMPTEIPTGLNQRLNQLLDSLRDRRVLLVLDNLETLLEEGEGRGRMLPGYEGYERLFRRVAESEHRSCLLITSREKPSYLVPLEGNQAPVRTLRLARLESKPCEHLLAEKGVTGIASEQARLIDIYAGNPLALKIVCQTIVDLFGGALSPFLEQGEIIFGGVRELLGEQFDRLSLLEQSVLLWLAILREPVTLNQLAQVLSVPVPRTQLLEAVDALYRRSLLERGQLQGNFTLQSVVLEYVTSRLITEACAEIQVGGLARLIEHGLMLAQARDYVRQSQERLIVKPILLSLQSIYSLPVALEERLLALLSHLQLTPATFQGYAPANLAALLYIQQGHLRHLNLSRLTLRGIYLQGVEMQDANLAGAMMQESVFTNAFDSMTAVAISKSGDYWAAASRGGEVLIWEADGLTLHWRWRAHSDMVWTVAFSPDGRTIATSSRDGKLKCWDFATGALLWSGTHENYVHRAAFAPDGRMVASSGPDAVVRLWDVKSGKLLHELPHPTSVFALTWHPEVILDGHLLASGDVEGTLHLWKVKQHSRGGTQALCVQTEAAHTNLIDDLKFSPDGLTLASAGWEGTVKLWEVDDDTTLLTIGGMRLQQTLTGHTNRVSRLAWSPDGHTLASCGLEKTIWLWDVETGKYRIGLQGHGTEVAGLSFTPDSHRLLSCSADGGLRVWNVTSGQCIRLLQGYTASLYDVAWSPDGKWLASGGTDRRVTVYTVGDEKPHLVLEGEQEAVFGVDWSPDGRWLASSEWDNTIRLWDAFSGACLQILHHPEEAGNYFYGIAWSPCKQHLAIATYQRGAQLLDMATNSPLWIELPGPTWIRAVAWSADGAWLAGGGNDGILYVWDATHRGLPQQLAGHQGMIISMSWSPDSLHLASTSSVREGSELVVWDVARGECTRTFPIYSETIYAVAWGQRDSLGVEMLVSGDGNGMLHWWNVQSGECVYRCQAHQGAVRGLRRSPDGTKLASCGDDGTILLWNLNNGEYLQTLRRDRPYERMDITNLTGITDAQRTSLLSLGAMIHSD